MVEAALGDKRPHLCLSTIHISGDAAMITIGQLSNALEVLFKLANEDHTSQDDTSEDDTSEDDTSEDDTSEAHNRVHVLIVNEASEDDTSEADDGIPVLMVNEASEYSETSEDTFHVLAVGDVLNLFTRGHGTQKALLGRFKD